MTTYTYSSDGTTVEAYRQKRPGSVVTPENGLVVGMPDEDMYLYGWYPERKATPVDPERLKTYALVPVILGNESVYAAIERDDTEQRIHEDSELKPARAVAGDARMQRQIRRLEGEERTQAELAYMRTKTGITL